MPKGIYAEEKRQGLFKKGHPGYWKGKKRSEQDKEKMRCPHRAHKAHKRRKPSIETRRKMSNVLRGEKNPNWKGGITKKNFQIRSSLEYRLWRESVFERDNWTCVWCGDNKGGNLNADHIKPFALFPELRFAIDNGRTLCEDCHKTTETFGSKTSKLKIN